MCGGCSVTDVSSILMHAAGLITGTGWTQNACARDFAGREVECHLPSAMCFCICGAIDRALIDLGHGRRCELYEPITELFGGYKRLFAFNDAPGRSAVEVANLLTVKAKAGAFVR